jgi:hypothetical protein
MGYGDESRNAATQVKLDPAQPVDSLVTNLMETIARKGRGFTLGLVEGQAQQRKAALEGAIREVGRLRLQAETDGAHCGLQKGLDGLQATLDDVLDGGGTGGVQVSVVESLPPHDEWERPAARRSHTLTDLPTFAAYAWRYGSPASSILFCALDHFVLVIDDEVARGARELVVLPNTLSDEWEAWRGLIEEEGVTHKQMLAVLMAHEHTLEDAEILASMSSVRATATVNYESDIQDDARSTGIFFKTTQGDELKRFPKRFKIKLPLWRQDLLDPRVWVELEIRLQINLPAGPQQPVTFTLHCPQMETAAQARLTQQMGGLRALLEGVKPVTAEVRAEAEAYGESLVGRTPWLIVAGEASYSERALGK